MGKIIDLTGQRFGKLVVIKREGSDKFKHSTWLCKCNCGNIKIVDSSHLKNGSTRSCGCLAKELLSKRMSKHNMSETRINRIWLRMRNRCNNKNNEQYKNYGGRGIKVCDEWLDKENGFINFYNWAINNGYKENLSIDRIDVNGDYEPNNCRWITMFDQQSNKRNNHFIEYYGKIYTVSQLSRYLKINKDTLIKRINNNWEMEDLNLPVRFKNKKYKEEM